MLNEISGDKCFEMLDKDKFIFFYFGASWCGPCQQILPKIEELSNQYDPQLIEFYKIDIDEKSNETLCNKCEIKVVPSCLIFKGRSFINRIKGGNNIQGIAAMINKVLFPQPIFQEPQQIQVKKLERDPFEENRKIFNKDNL